MRRSCPGEKERCLLRQTANYQLSQWDAEDRILREDFNRDNEKIDEAIDQANRMVRLLDVVTDSEAEQVDLDLTGFDAEQYTALKLYFQTTASSVLVRINNLTSYYGATNFGGAEGQCNFLARSAEASTPVTLSGELTLMLSRTAAGYWLVSAFLLSGNGNKVEGSRGTCVCTGALKNLNLISNAEGTHIPTGSSIRLYGIKK